MDFTQGRVLPLPTILATIANHPNFGHMPNRCCKTQLQHLLLSYTSTRHGRKDDHLIHINNWLQTSNHRTVMQQERVKQQHNRKLDYSTATQQERVKQQHNRKLDYSSAMQQESETTTQQNA